MAHRPIRRRQYGWRRVIAHRSDRFLRAFGHRREYQLQCLQREAGGRLAAQQFFAAEQYRFRAGADLGLQLDHSLQPFLVRRLCGEMINDLPMVIELSGLEVRRDHAARRNRATPGDFVIAKWAHAGFRANREDTIRGQSIAQRAQAVAVQPRDRPAAVEGGDSGRAVPWFHHGVAIIVQSPVRHRHDRLAFRPGFRDQHRLRHRRRAARLAEHLPDGIERARIRGTVRDDRLDVVYIVAVSLGDHPDLVALHPVLVAAQRVDLAVVRDHPERLGQRPLREGVGRIALVIDRERRDESLITQVKIEIIDIGCKEHALVDQRLVVQRADIEGRDARLPCAPLNAAAADVELALHVFRAAATSIAEHDLLDGGACVLGLLSDYGDIHRRLAPAVDVESRPQHFPFDDRAARFLRRKICTRKKYLAHADTVVSRGMACTADMLAEEVLRNVKANTGAVAGLAVGVDGAAVPDVLQGRDAHRNDLTLRLAVERYNEANAAGVLLIFRIVGVAVDQFLAIGFILFHIFRHLTYSAATLVDAMAFIALCIASAASRPSLIAQTTSEAPRTISPAA